MSLAPELDSLVQNRDRQGELKSETVDRLDDMVRSIEAVIGAKSPEISEYRAFVQLGAGNYLDVQMAAEQGIVSSELAERKYADCLYELSQIGQEAIMHSRDGQAYQLSLESAAENSTQTLVVTSYDVLDNKDIREKLMDDDGFKWSTDEMQEARLNDYRVIREALTDKQILVKVHEMFDIASRPFMYDIPLSDLPVDMSKYSDKTYSQLSDEERQAMINEYRQNNDLFYNQEVISRIRLDLPAMLQDLVTEGVRTRGEIMAESGAEAAGPVSASRLRDLAWHALKRLDKKD